MVKDIYLPEDRRAILFHYDVSLRRDEDLVEAATGSIVRHCDVSVGREEALVETVGGQSYRLSFGTQTRRQTHDRSCVVTTLSPPHDIVAHLCKYWPRNH